MKAGVGARTPQQKVTGVAERLESYLRRYDTAHDHRAPFTYIYLRLTRSLAAGLGTGEPAFDDPDWVANLSVALSGAYFAAMDGIDDWVETRQPDGQLHPDDLPASIPQPWRDVYAASSVPRSYVLEDVLFSMMAHMSYDLPLTLRGMGDRQDIESRIADFHRMNDVLASCIDEVQNGLAARYWHVLADLDRLLTRQDELLSNYGVRVARGMAWFNFDRLSNPQARAAAELSIKKSTAGLIEEIRAPNDSRLRLGLQVARWLVPSRRKWPNPASDV